MKRATSQWLEAAEMDLGSIEQIIEREDLTPVAAFRSQQCVEKCFKAVLEEQAQKVPKEHSTLMLLIPGTCSLFRLRIEYGIHRFMAS